MKFLSNVLIKAGLIVEGATQLSTLSGNVLIGGTVDAGFKADVYGTARVQNRLTLTHDIYFPNNNTDGIVITGANVVYPKIIVGSENTVSGNTNLIFGKGNTSTGLGFVFGNSNTANSNTSMIFGVGNQANTSGQYTVLIGGNNTTSHGITTFTGMFAIGNANVLAHQGSSIMGSNQTTTGNNQLIFASSQSNVNSAGFNDIYFGTGPRSKNTNLLGSNITINGSGAGAGTDLSGGSVTIAGGKGTGTGTPGDVIISTATALTTGTTLQSLSNRIVISGGTGLITISNLAGSGERLVSANASGALVAGVPISITSPSSGQVLKFNGTSWVNDSDAGITGSGTTNYLPKFTGASTLGNSIIFDNGTSVGISSASPSAGIKLQVDGSVFVNRSGNVNYVLNSASSHYGFIQNDAGNKWSLSSGTSLTTGLGTAALTWFSTGNVSIGNLSDNGLRFQVTGDGYFSGSVGIGTTTLTAISLRVSKNLTGAVSSIGIVQEGQVQTDVTSAATGFRNLLNTAASTTLGDYYHIRLGQGTIGAGTTLTQQIGLYINDFANGTSRYGILSELSAGTGKWNLYMNGTARNYLAGNTGIGTNNPLGLFHVSGDGVSYFTRGTKDLIINPNVVGGNTVALIDVTSGMAISFGSIGGSERMRIDGSGNLGLGVVPSAWSLASLSAMQIQNGGFYGYSVNEVGVTSNSYYNAGWKYINSSFATQYSTFNGAHRWYNAPSGTAGNAITFTQAMTLDASGNLALGIATASSRLHVDAAAGSAHIRVSEAGTTRGFVGGANGIATGLNGYFMVRGEAGLVLSGNGNSSDLVIRPTTANVLIGTTTDAGFRLDVNGTMRVSGASTFGGIMTLTGAYISLNANGYIRTDNANFLTLQSGSSGFVVKNSGNANDNFVVNNSGAGTFLSSATATSFIAASSQPNTSDYNYLIFNNLAGGYGDWNIYKSGANNLSLGYGTDGGTTYTNALTFTYGAGATFSSNVRAANLGIGRDADLVTNSSVISVGGTNGTYYRAFTGATETFRIQTTATTTNLQAFGGDLRIDTGSQTYAMLLTSGGGIGIGVTAVNASAKLQVESVTQGFLPPRMTSTQRAAISTPSVGLVVYQTDGTEGLYIYTNASGWKSLAIVN